jgi:hypothetical protein
MDDRKVSALANGTSASGSGSSGKRRVLTSSRGGASAGDSTIPAALLQSTFRRLLRADGANATSAADTAAPSGIDWERLRQRFPALYAKGTGSRTEAFEKAKAAVEAIAAASGGGNGTAAGSAGGIAYLSEPNRRPWETGLLSLQAVAYIMEAAHVASAANTDAEGDFAAADDGVFDRDPLARLVSVAGNFPSYAGFLSTLPVSQDLMAEVETNAGVSFGGAASSYMSLNGIGVDPSSPTFNVFSLLRVLRAEAHVVSQYDALPVEAAEREKIRGLSIAGSAESAAAEALAAELGGGSGSGGARDGGAGKGGGALSVRVDVLVDAAEQANNRIVTAPSTGVFEHPVPIVQWYQDVEENPMFTRWPTSLTTLLQPSWQLHAIRRNIYTALFVLPDLSSPTVLRTIGTLSYLTQMRLPLRLGIVIATPILSEAERGAAAVARAQNPVAGTAADQSAATGRQLALLYASACAKYGEPAGRAFLDTLVGEWGRTALDDGSGMGASGEPIKVSQAIEVFAGIAKLASKAWSASAGTEAAEAALKDADGKIGEVLAKVTHWVESRGLPAPCMVINGLVRTSLDVQTDLMQTVSRDMALLQKAVQEGSLDDGVTPSVYHAFMGRASKLTGRKKKRPSKSAAPDAPETTGTLSVPGAGIVVPRYAPAVFVEPEHQQFIPLAAPEFAPLISAAGFVHAPTTGDDVKPVSMMLFDDLSTAAGLRAAEALLQFTAPGSAAGTAQIFGISSKMASEVARWARFASVHVPSVTLNVDDSAAGKTTVPDLGMTVAAIWALATGLYPSVFSVSVDQQGPLLSAAIDAALVTVSSGSATAAAYVDLLSTALVKARGDWPGLKNHQSVKLVDALRLLVTKTAEGKGKEDIWPWTFVSSQAEAATLARNLIADALPEALDVDDTGALTLRALAANGRVLALDRNVQTCDAATSAKHASSFLPATGGAGSLLPGCLSPADAAVLALHERAVRGVSVAALVQSMTFPPGTIDPDDINANRLSALVQGAAAAVGSSLTVSSGQAGGQTTTRQALRTDSMLTKNTYFVSRPQGKKTSSGLNVVAVVNPVSEDGQKIAPLLLMLRDRLGATVHVHLTPTEKGAAEIPLKSFYRFVLPADVSPCVLAGECKDTSALSAWQQPAASFAWLPEDPVLTLKTHVPEPWNMQTAAAEVDLDNMKLRDILGAYAASDSVAAIASAQLIGSIDEDENDKEVDAYTGVKVKYFIRDVLVAGQCFDVTHNSFVNGLQLTLHTKEAAGALVSDTLVMQNLGYWQLKANPGTLFLSLAKGRALELYSLVLPASEAPATASAGSGARARARALAGASSTDRRNWHKFVMQFAESQKRTDLPAGSDVWPWTGEVAVPALPIYVRDFTGPVTFLAVRKRTGQERSTLLETLGTEQADHNPGFFGSLKKSIFGGDSSVEDAEAGRRLHADGSVDTRPLIHVFSLASGHLFERFLKIMMLSAVKRTERSRIKFWLVENFLSPQFKKSIPALSQK